MQQILEWLLTLPIGQRNLLTIILSGVILTAIALGYAFACRPKTPVIRRRFDSTLSLGFALAGTLLIIGISTFFADGLYHSFNGPVNGYGWIVGSRYKLCTIGIKEKDKVLITTIPCQSQEKCRIGEPFIREAWTNTFKCGNVSGSQEDSVIYFLGIGLIGCLASILAAEWICRQPEPAPTPKGHKFEDS